MSATLQQEPLAPDRVFSIAHADAVRAYGDLSDYRISIRLHADGWHIDYDLTDPNLNGGGPRYVIDPTDGTIISKKYYQ